jgi:hypothetical protein
LLLHEVCITIAARAVAHVTTPDAPRPSRARDAGAGCATIAEC